MVLICQHLLANQKSYILSVLCASVVSEIRGSVTRLPALRGRPNLARLAKLVGQVSEIRVSPVGYILSHGVRDFLSSPEGWLGC